MRRKYYHIEKFKNKIVVIICWSFDLRCHLFRHTASLLSVNAMVAIPIKGEKKQQGFLGKYVMQYLLSIAPIALLVYFQFATLTSIQQSQSSVEAFHSTRDLTAVDQKPSLMLTITNNNNFTLQPFYQNPVILQKNCSVTVLFVDPNLGKDAMWALESVVANILPLETTCVFIQTSVCDTYARNHQYPNKHDNNDEIGQYQRKARQVRDLAEPLFGNLIDQGHVRMKVLSHTKYNLHSCSNFYNPSHLFENYQFWGSQEFLPQDSDLVLMSQADAVLCHKLHVDKWRDVAWVGAPWPAKRGKQGWHFCSSLPTSWKEFHRDGGSGKKVPKYPTKYQLCHDTTYGPQGNGGVSLRSRSWLRKAIEYCPVEDRAISGLAQDAYGAAPCKATSVAAEDIYFVTILRGIGAPLPNNYEAALFAMELRSPAAIANQFHLNQSFIETMIQKRWYSLNDPTGMDDYRNVMKAGKNLSSGIDPLVPIAVHKPWNNYLGERITEDYLNEQCPYMKKVVETSKYGIRYLNKERRSS
jgi:hypothetical protein